MAWTFSPVSAFTSTGFSPVSSCISLDFAWDDSLWLPLLSERDFSLSWKMFKTGTTGIFLSFSILNHSFSVSSQSLNMRMAMSVSSSAFIVRPTRISPSPSASSSKPAVSMNRHGPMAGISIAFLTGSAVVPGTSDTSDAVCPVIAFMRLDFPLLRFPKIPMCSLSD